MIVYGSPQRTVATSAALAAVYHLAQRAPTEPHADTTRRLLLALGELAQGVADAPDPAPVTVQGLHAALLLVGTALYEQQEPESPGATHAQLNRAFAAVAALTTLPVPPQITIHQPEGFAFYGLYPERYFHAVQAGPLWQMDPALAVCVIGIRSIGTALAAAVGGALAARGATVHVTSVRPSGHPFARELVLDGELLRGIAASAFTAYVVRAKRRACRDRRSRRWVGPCWTRGWRAMLSISSPRMGMGRAAPPAPPCAPFGMRCGLAPHQWSICLSAYPTGPSLGADPAGP